MTKEAPTNNNWIKLNRGLMNNPLWKIKPFSKGQAWVDLLMLTNHTVGFITTKNGKLIEIKRGDCGYSVLSLAQRWGWGRGKINRFFELLNGQKMIQQKITENHTVISIINYDLYQNSTINSTINDTINSTINGHKQECKERKEYITLGEFKNVFLSENEHKKLEEIYNGTFCEAVEILSSYKASTGKKYKSDYAVLGKHNWVYAKLKQESGKEQGSEYAKYTE